MRKKARPLLPRLTRDNVNSYQAKQYIGPRIFCFSFLNICFFSCFILFLSFFFVCFVFLIFFVLTFLSCTGYTCRLNTFSISESDIALAKTLKCDTLAIDWIIVIIITGESAFIILALMEETSGKFQDGKTYKINEGSYKCVCICICIYLYIYIYILKLHGTENFTSERIDCEMSSERRDLFMY